MVKSFQPGEGGGGGARSSLFSYLPSRPKLWCTIQLRKQIHCSHFFSTSTCTLWLGPSSSVSFFICISPLLPFEPRGKILMEIYLMTQFRMLLSSLVRKSNHNVCAIFPSESLIYSPYIELCWTIEHVLTGCRKQFPGSQAAFCMWMVFRVICSYLKAVTSLVKRENVGFFKK